MENAAADKILFKSSNFEQRNFDSAYMGQNHAVQNIYQ